MSGERIDIEVQDKVAPGIRDKILAIADAADKGHSNVAKLRGALKDLDDSALRKLSSTFNNTASATLKQAQAQNALQASTDRTALAQQRLATEQQKTAAAAAMAAAAQSKATAAQTGTATAAQRLATATAQASTAQQKMATEAQRTAAATAQAAAAQDRAALAALRLEQAQKRAAEANERQSNSLLSVARSAAAMFAGYVGTRELIQSADNVTTLNNSLVNLAENSQGLDTLKQRLFAMAKETRQPVNDLVESFVRFDTALKRMGSSQEESLRFTDIMAKGIQSSGKAGASAAAGLYQFSQALSKGKLDGDEFRSVMENIPFLADLIAAEMKVPTNALQKLSAEGKITADVLRRTILNSADVIQEKFSKLSPTIGGAFSNIGTAWTQLLDKFEQSTGLFNAIARGILFIGDNFDAIAPAVVALGAGLLVAFGPALVSAIGTAASAVGAFTATLLANPLVALAAAITVVVVLLYQYRDAITVGLDGTTTLGDVFRATWEFMVAGWTTLVESVKAFGSALYEFIKPALDWLEGIFGKFTSNVDLSFAGLVRAWAKYQDTIIGVGLGTVKALIAAWNGFPAAFADVILSATNAGIKMFENFVNAAVMLLNKLIGAINKIGDNDLTRAMGLDFKAIGELDTVSFGKIENQYEGAFKQMGTNVANAFSEGYNANPITKTVDAIFSRAQEIGKERTANPVATGDGLRGAGAGMPTSDASAAKAAEKRATAMARVNRELDAELKNLGMLRPEREVASKMSQIENELANKKIQLSQQEREELEAKVRKVQELQEVQSQLDAIYNQMVQPMTDYNATLQAANQLMEQGVINGQQYFDTLLNARARLLESQNTVASGLELGFVKIQQDVNNVAGTISSTMTSAFGKVEDALTNFVTTGKLDFKELANSIIQDIARMVIKLLILRPLMNGLGGMFGGGGMGFGGFSTGGEFNVPTFATGGQFNVGGSQVGDKNLVAFRANGGERVTVETKGQQRRSDGGKNGAPVVHLNISTPDAKSFVQSEGQVAAAAARAIQRGYRNM